MTTKKKIPAPATAKKEPINIPKTTGTPSTNDVSTKSPAKTQQKPPPKSPPAPPKSPPAPPAPPAGATNNTPTPVPSDSQNMYYFIGVSVCLVLCISLCSSSMGAVAVKR
jgi:hypothetical protein